MFTLSKMGNKAPDPLGHLRDECGHLGLSLPVILTSLRLPELSPHTPSHRGQLTRTPPLRNQTTWPCGRTQGGKTRSLYYREQGGRTRTIGFPTWMHPRGSLLLTPISTGKFHKKNVKIQAKFVYQKQGNTFVCPTILSPSSLLFLFNCHEYGTCIQAVSEKSCHLQNVA